MMTQFDRTRWHRLVREKIKGRKNFFFFQDEEPTRYYYAKVLIVRDKLSKIHQKFSIQ